ncbi:membrane hypothetical protein [Gammaproteobacteria bacterium]
MTPIHLLISFITANLWRLCGALIGEKITKNEKARAAIDGMAIALISGIVIQMTFKYTATPIYIKMLSLIVASVVYLKTSRQISYSVFAGLITFISISYLDDR